MMPVLTPPEVVKHRELYSDGILSKEEFYARIILGLSPDNLSAVREEMTRCASWNDFRATLRAVQRDSSWVILGTHPSRQVISAQAYRSVQALLHDR